MTPISPFPHKRNHYFRKEFLYDTVFLLCSYFRARQTTLLLKILGDGCMGRPPTSNKKTKKSKDSLVPVVAMAILSHIDRRMALKDINKFIANRGDRSLIEKPTWKNNVRYVLSHYEFFIKSARVATGAGYYWSIHPACVGSFSAGDFSIKKA